MLHGSPNETMRCQAHLPSSHRTSSAPRERCSDVSARPCNHGAPLCRTSVFSGPEPLKLHRAVQRLPSPRLVTKLVAFLRFDQQFAGALCTKHTHTHPILPRTASNPRAMAGPRTCRSSSKSISSVGCQLWRSLSPTRRVLSERPGVRSRKRSEAPKKWEARQGKANQEPTNQPNPSKQANRKPRDCRAGPTKTRPRAGSPASCAASFQSPFVMPLPTEKAQPLLAAKQERLELLGVRLHGVSLLGRTRCQ